jgi:hypothetical protein
MSLNIITQTGYSKTPKFVFKSFKSYMNYGTIYLNLYH